MSFGKWTILFLVLLLIAGAGCRSTDESTQAETKAAPAETKAAPQEPAPVVSTMSHDAILELIQDRKFFEAYTVLAQHSPRDDWDTAYMLFVGGALKKLEDSAAAPKGSEAVRAQAKQYMAAKDYYKALETAFAIEPKTDEDIGIIMEASYSLFDQSGGKEISRYLATVMVGFMYARSQKSAEWEAKTQEALKKIGTQKVGDQQQYKQALVNSARFFKQLGQEFENLTVRHLQYAGYDLLEIQTADFDKQARLQEKAMQGDRYSAVYLWWFDAYSEFNLLVTRLLDELSS